MIKLTFCLHRLPHLSREDFQRYWFEKHAPLIDRDMRFEIMERMDAQGTVLIPLDEEQVLTVARNAVGQGVTAIAILFLHSYRNAAHEKTASSFMGVLALAAALDWLKS